MDIWCNMKVTDVIIESKTPEEKAVKIWLKVSDLLVDLEDELLEVAKARNNPHAEKAITHLRNNELAELHRVLRAMFHYKLEHS